ncbi:putative type VI secretion system effector [Acinetobacter sp. NIPH 2699]|uniref:putative type VI secretion system effector n=1 Tax=Acinetobacter sp. NIPH 2699 TaxID=2923433 RepID=UPI001F4C296E|nr:putative type VI secretion system effector [Acinetobacter sp. NIPH 2699]MCH7337902.1 hypothetical protein [Acinetobacter sp. NIPH 2699]
MLVVEGCVRNLKVEDSKIHPFRNIEKQAAGTAMVGALTASSSLATNAPIMLMAAQGEDAKSFICEVGDYRVIGQFTTVQFKNGDELVWVISEEKEQGRHLVYSTLNPKTGLLHMINEMGRSLKSGYIDVIKMAIAVALFFVLLGNTIIVVTWFISEDGLGFSWLMHIFGFILFPFPFTFTFLFVLSTFLFSRDQKQACRLSEQVFEVLGFEDVKNQDFRANNYFSDEDGKLRRSVMHYRKNLKGKDPYPENYFDKK